MPQDTTADFWETMERSFQAYEASRSKWAEKLLMVAAAIKHRGFAEEQEWRFVGIGGPHSDHRFRGNPAEHFAFFNRNRLRNGSNNLILQPRDLRLLRALSEHRILTRDQAADLSSFHSTTRVNVRLSKLRWARLIQRYFVAGATGSRGSVYALTRKGAQTAQLPFQPLKWSADSVIIGNAFAAHYLALNDVRIAMSKPGQTLALWKTLDEPISSAAKLVPDALIEQKIDDEWRSMFLEVDLGTETLPTWTNKTRHYLHLATDIKSIILVAMHENR